MADKEFLPGNIRERIRDLLKDRKMTQAELAARIGSTESTISRFMSEKTDKFGDENIVKIAEVFGVSTDFILGVTELPDRKNYDISELGLSSLAAKNLYTRKVNAEVVSRLLENQRFAVVTNMIAQYFDETLAVGIAVQNQLFSSINAMLLGYGKVDPDDKTAAADSAQTVQLMKTSASAQVDLTNIENTFMAAVREIKKDMQSNIKPTQQATRDVVNKLMANLTKGQDAVDLRSITPEQIVDAIASTVSGMDGATPEQMEQFKEMALPLFTPPDKSDAGDD